MVVLYALVVVTDKSVLHDRVVGCLCRIGGGVLRSVGYETVVVTDGDIGVTDVGILYAAFVLFHFTFLLGFAVGKHGNYKALELILYNLTLTINLT